MSRKRAQSQGIGRGQGLLLIQLCWSGGVGEWCAVLASAGSVCVGGWWYWVVLGGGGGVVFGPL